MLDIIQIKRVFSERELTDETMLLSTAFDDGNR